MACSRLSDSRDDAVKGVQKYERVNLRKGGRWRLFSLSRFLNLELAGLEKATFLSFIRYTPKKKCVDTYFSSL